MWERIFKWAAFGAVIGFIVSLISLVFLAIIGLFIPPLLFGLVFSPLVVLIAVIVGAIGWIFLGLIYDIFLVRLIGELPLFWQMFALLFVWGIITAILSLQPSNLVSAVLSSLIAGVIVYVVVLLTGISTPFES